MTDPVTRINALTANARSTWFALLSVLLFVGITLMGVENIDFYGVDRATQLPLINVAVPTPLFFYAAPILTAAVYGYFHLYLIRLWDALGAAPAEVLDDDGSTRLGDAISPWLITDAALLLRNRLRGGDNCTETRALEGAAMLLNFLIAWVFGLVVLAALWWQSMPARQWDMTLIAGCALMAGAVSGATSASLLVIRMRPPDKQEFRGILVSTPAVGRTLAMLPLVFAIGFLRTAGQQHNLAALDLSDQDLVEHPTGWLPYPIARKGFLATWCKRENIPNCSDLDDRQQEFDAEWKTRRTAALAALKKPHWNGSANGEPDLRHADLSRTFLAGADLSEAQMQGAILINAQLEWADLSEARMQGADLRDARMQGADLRDAQMQEAYLRDARMQEAYLRNAQMQGAYLVEAQMQEAYLHDAQMQRAYLVEAQMQGAHLRDAQLQGAYLNKVQMEGADLSWAQMGGADLREAQMERADLSRAQMGGADLRDAQMEGADLRWAQMEGADLSRAHMQGADLSWAQMEGADLSWAQMEGADLSWALLTGTTQRPNLLETTNLRTSVNRGGALRFVDLTQAEFDSKTDWRNAFFDASVTVPPDRRVQIGQPCLWDWIETQSEPLSDEKFFGHWRGWLAELDDWPDSIWRRFAPAPYHDVPALPPPPGCRWITEPLPGAGDAD